MQDMMDLKLGIVIGNLGRHGFNKGKTDGKFKNANFRTFLDNIFKYKNFREIEAFVIFKRGRF